MLNILYTCLKTRKSFSVFIAKTHARHDSFLDQGRQGAEDQLVYILTSGTSKDNRKKKK
ncbi:hypothetical protein BCV72DRAFT_318234 [Rhizopus microsporus var. microsporus]|uniref:Uncharacterized protein n=1 Tax=Rhizopus microsporus var. microsporus TaxID=86635 RepID=A0A1X0RCL2_RHIZD|nr:hypothetical protein BCV72DRAFT_318234 [Rhizopus microsporus var. microsporus]